jgi:hypothetical protein
VPGNRPFLSINHIDPVRVDILDIESMLPAMAGSRFPLCWLD